MKNLKTIGFIAGFIVIGAAVLIGTWKLGDHFQSLQHTANKPKISTATCAQKGQAHTVIVKDNQAKPGHTDGKLCDTLTITNEDDAVRLMAFGPHEDHQPYDGVTEKELAKGQSLTVTLNEAGTFEFHDHIGDIVKGDFTVTK